MHKLNKIFPISKVLSESEIKGIIEDTNKVVYKIFALKVNQEGEANSSSSEKENKKIPIPTYEIEGEQYLVCEVYSINSPLCSMIDQYGQELDKYIANITRFKEHTLGIKPFQTYIPTKPTVEFPVVLAIRGKDKTQYETYCKTPESADKLSELLADEEIDLELIISKMVYIPNVKMPL